MTAVRMRDCATGPARRSGACGTTDRSRGGRNAGAAGASGNWRLSDQYGGATGDALAALPQPSSAAAGRAACTRVDSARAHEMRRTHFIQTQAPRVFFVGNHPSTGMWVMLMQVLHGARLWPHIVRSGTAPVTVGAYCLTRKESSA